VLIPASEFVKIWFVCVKQQLNDIIISMEQVSSGEANSNSASQEVFHLL
jgi:hypothetical protein